LGDLGVTYRVHLWLDRMCIVNFLLAIIELFSLALMAIERNLSKSAFSEGVGYFERKFSVDGDIAHNPSMDR